VSRALPGLALGLGLALVLTSRLHRRARLADRVAPWVGAGPAPAVPRGHRWTARLARRADEILGGSATVRDRLELAGGDLGLEDFRAQQVAAGTAGFTLGCGLLALRGSTGAGPGPLPLLALTLALTVGGVLGREWWLGRRVRRRQELVAAELPVVADLLALAVAAGEGLGGALDRVARLAHGELGRELRRAVAETRAGLGIETALGEVGRRTGVPGVGRFTRAVVTALDHGTPLAGVLRAQAGDAREARRRHLLEEGGRREIACLLPVVFLILPVVVLFAVYPALTGLSVAVH